MRQEILATEEILDAWNGVTLTSERLLQSTAPRGQTVAVTLFLNKIDHVSLLRAHHGWLYPLANSLILAAIVLLLTARSPVPPIVLGLAGNAALIVYFSTRQLELRVGAGAGLIRVRVVGGGAGAKAARAFMQRIDGAVLARGRSWRRELAEPPSAED